MLDKLEMFIALARESHFGRAAESLNISQPTLSAGIKQLEEQLGVQLVIRGSRYGGLTPEGQSALVWARRITADTRQLRDEMRAKRHGLSGEIRLAVIPTALTWAAHLSSRFADRHPNVRFTILSHSSREIQVMLDSFEADAGISYLDNEPLGRVDTAALYRERYVLLCRDDARLASRKSVTWEDLDAEPLALLTPEMQNRRIINQVFADYGAAPAPLIESNSLIALVSSVLGGRCMTVLPDDIARFLASGQPLRIVPIEGDAQRHSVGLVVPHRDPHTPVIEALLAAADRLSRPKA
ncbi:LysR family transcriptional regulator [Tropicibacter alexandrii]|uniref:LysR family transcriptional regulator n=1 Tax=Tropicibacter alexandrii TaxID=2267683 RepID=UPI000EF4AEE1|nr:LysR family transcriptional regulator [Tropicibacter alexandrii]